MWNHWWFWWMPPKKAEVERAHADRDAAVRQLDHKIDEACDTADKSKTSAQNIKRIMGEFASKLERSIHHAII